MSFNIISEPSLTSTGLSEPFSFAYTIRESARARQAQLRITSRRGLEVIIPKRLVGRVDVGAFLQEKRNWIEKHLSAQPSFDDSFVQEALPTHLPLRSIEESWSVAYVANRRFELLENSLQQLTLLGNINNKARCRESLMRWLKCKAGLHLGSLLLQLSHEAELPFRSFQIRAQQTRWGSCSSEGDISLNYQLLFLPSPLVKHILLHELAHTRHLHHGVRFWSLLKKLDSNTKEHAHQAKRASSYVPRWIG